MIETHYLYSDNATAIVTNREALQLKEEIFENINWKLGFPASSMPRTLTSLIVWLLTLFAVLGCGVYSLARLVGLLLQIVQGSSTVDQTIGQLVVWLLLTGVVNFMGYRLLVSFFKLMTYEVDKTQRAFQRLIEQGEVLTGEVVRIRPAHESREIPSTFALGRLELMYCVVIPGSSNWHRASYVTAQRHLKVGDTILVLSCDRDLSIIL